MASTRSSRLEAWEAGGGESSLDTSGMSNGNTDFEEKIKRKNRFWIGKSGKNRSTLVAAFFQTLIHFCLLFLAFSFFFNLREKKQNFFRQITFQNANHHSKIEETSDYEESIPFQTDQGEYRKETGWERQWVLREWQVSILKMFEVSARNK